MREIKFRAWSPGIKQNFGKRWIFEPQMLFDDKPGDCLVWKNQNQDLIVMQYTGITDRNGKEIYEGDIVDYWRGPYRRKWGIVEFGEYEQDGSGGEYSATKCFGFYIETIKLFPTPLDLEFNDDPCEAEEEKTVSILEFDNEVIGNTYANPELVSP